MFNFYIPMSNPGLPTALSPTSSSNIHVILESFILVFP